MTQLLHNIPFWLLGLILLSLGCDPAIENLPTQKLDFSCVQLFDEQGQTMGTYGGCTTSPDWGKITLSGEEQSFLAFSDTVGLAGTVAATITQLAISPNPVTRNGALFFSLRSTTPDQAVKLKIAIIDEDKNVLGQYSLRTTTNSHNNAIQINEGTYPPGKFYRVYYRASSQGHANLFEGFGNILVCKKQIIDGNIDGGDCF